MKISPEQLAGQLQNKLLPVYWVAGDEALLIQETTDQLRSYCRQQNFTERELYSVESNFDWQTLLQSSNSLSLFAEKKIIELRLKSNKLGDDGRKALQTYVEISSPDNVLIIVSPKLDSRTLNTKWFKAIESKGVLVQIWPIDVNRLPQWITARLRNNGIQADQQAIRLLADKVEGNLLAASQEIEKLKLLANNESGGEIQLDSKTVLQVVADSSRYNVFNLVDTALQGNAKRSLKIISGLRNEGTEPRMILGLICRELRSLVPMMVSMEKGLSIDAAMQSARVWNNRKAAVMQALKRLNTEAISRLLQQAKLIDHSVKGLATANPWIELDKLVLPLCGTEIEALGSRLCLLFFCFLLLPSAPCT